MRPIVDPWRPVQAAKGKPGRRTETRRVRAIARVPGRAPTAQRPKPARSSPPGVAPRMPGPRGGGEFRCRAPYCPDWCPARPWANSTCASCPARINALGRSCVWQWFAVDGPSRAWPLCYGEPPGVSRLRDRIQFFLKRDPAPVSSARSRWPWSGSPVGALGARSRVGPAVDPDKGPELRAPSSPGGARRAKHRRQSTAKSGRAANGAPTAPGPPRRQESCA